MHVTISQSLKWNLQIAPYVKIQVLKAKDCSFTVMSDKGKEQIAIVGGQLLNTTLHVLLPFLPGLSQVF